MCDGRDNGFAVATKRTAGMGFWIGEILGGNSFLPDMKGEEVALCQVSIMWAENQQCGGESVILCDSRNFLKVGSVQEAFERLKAIGVCGLA